MLHLCFRKSEIIQSISVTDRQTDSRPLDIDIVRFDVPLDIMTSFWRRFYGSYDLTNSVIAQTHGRAHIACTAL